MQQTFKRTCVQKNTLVFEPLGQWLHIIDPTVEGQDPINDTTQIKCKINGVYYVALIKWWPQKLAIYLSKLFKYYELVIFTILPDEIVKRLFELCPELGNLVSHSLSYSHLVTSDEGYVYKDLAFLSENRQEQDGQELETRVVDILDAADHVDGECITYFQS